jgi:hypothetical protein
VTLGIDNAVVAVWDDATVRRARVSPYGRRVVKVIVFDVAKVAGQQAGAA